jgi:uncharacterized protein
VRRLVRADMIAAVRGQFDADREARFAGRPPAMMAVVSDDPAVPAALPTADSYAWFTETGRTRAPAWRNQTTLRTVEMFTEYEPGAYIDKVAPTPLLMVVAREDHLTVVDQALAAYNQALEPKRLEILPGGHFDAYTGPDFELSSAAARDWLVRHLGPPARVPATV